MTYTKEEYHREEAIQEHLDDLRAEANTREITVYFKGKIVIKTYDTELAKDMAIERLNEEDVYDYINELKTD